MSYATLWTHLLAAAPKRQRGHEIRTTCPSCGKDKHCYCNDQKGVFMCFAEGCGAQGSIIDFMRLLGLTEAEIAQLMREHDLWK